MESASGLSVGSFFGGCQPKWISPGDLESTACGPARLTRLTALNGPSAATPPSCRSCESPSSDWGGGEGWGVVRLVVQGGISSPSLGYNVLFSCFPSVPSLVIPCSQNTKY